MTPHSIKSTRYRDSPSLIGCAPHHQDHRPAGATGGRDVGGQFAELGVLIRRKRGVQAPAVLYLQVVTAAGEFVELDSAAVEGGITAHW